MSFTATPHYSDGDPDPDGRIAIRGVLDPEREGLEHTLTSAIGQLVDDDPPPVGVGMLVTLDHARQLFSQIGTALEQTEVLLAQAEGE